MGKKHSVSGTFPRGSSAVALKKLAAQVAKPIPELYNMQHTDCTDVPDGTAVVVQKLGARFKGTGLNDKDDWHAAGRRLADVLGMTCMLAELEPAMWDPGGLWHLAGIADGNVENFRHCRQMELQRHIPLELSECVARRALRHMGEGQLHQMSPVRSLFVLL